MLKPRIKTVLPAIAGAALLASAAALAHGGATGIVKERMDLMGSIGKQMKVIVPMMKGKSDFDPDSYAAAARRISGHGGASMTRLFPEGSLEKPSEARPEIWKDWTEFSRLAEELGVAGAELARAAASTTQADDLAQPFARVAKTCRDCHQAFRVKK